MDHLGLFLGALAMAYMVPGPDMVLILQTSAVRGRWHALATACGLAIARSVHVLLAATGLAALLRTAPILFDIVRFCGAAYLVWLGIAVLRNGPLLQPADGRQVGDRAGSLRLALLRGLLTNHCNPKALLFCSVLLPQFMLPGQGDVASQFLMLGTILVATGFAFDLFYAGAGAAMARWITRIPAVQAAQRWTFASLLIGFGLRLALAARLA